MALSEAIFGTKTISPGTEPQAVFASHLNVSKIGFRLRTLGTASYVAIGGDNVNVDLRIKKLAYTKAVFGTKTITPGIASTAVFSSEKKVSKLGFRLRILGTATYVAIGGDSTNVDFRLVKDDNYFEIPTPQDSKYLNAAEIYVKSDVDAQATIEVFWIEINTAPYEKDDYFEIPIPQDCKYLDASKIFVKSDVASQATIEVFWVQV